MEKSNWARALALALGVLAASGPGVAMGFEFMDRVLLGAGASSVAVGDLDGDGLDDIAMAGSLNRFDLYLQSPEGGFAPRERLTPEVETIRALRFADIDGDGANELLVGHDHGLVVYDHVDGLRYLSPGNSCVNLVTGDINLDGWEDVVCHSAEGIAVFYINDGEGWFLPAVHMLTPLVGRGESKQVQLADVSGDGLPDLVLAGPSGGGFFVHRQDGEGGFLPADVYPHPGHIDRSAPGGIEVLDIDHDGVPEIITTTPGNQPTARLHIYRRDAHGQYRFSEDRATYDIPVQLLAYDVDRDGIRDLFVMHRGWSSVGHYMGGADGLSQEEVLSTTGLMWVGSTGYSLGDVNGDDCTDLVVGTTGGASIHYGVCPRRVVNDFDGDGTSDIFWRSSAGGANVVWPSAEAGLSRAVTSVPDPAWKVAGQGDFDGDGQADLFWRHGGSGANTIWRSADSATPRLVTSVTDLDWQVAGIGDFDGDGRSDVLWRHAVSGRNAIWKSGGSATQQAVYGVTDVLWEVAGIGDFDGDGRSDILWRHATSGINAIWKGGDFQDQQAVTGVANTAWRVAGVGDFDGDGRADILWRNESSGMNVVWAGADHADQRPVTGVLNLAWRVAAVADYDGDGRADILWRRQDTGGNVIWLGGDYATQRPVGTAGPAWTTPR